MPNRFSSAKFSIAQCDRCGFRTKLKELRSLTIKTKKVNILVCNECWEQDHPQLQLGMYPVNDPQAVMNPRSDVVNYPQSRSYTEVFNTGVATALAAGNLDPTSVLAAALDLVFTSGALDSRVTFTRASTATRVNASGLIESVAINGPRFDYDPVTLAPKGLLIEEQRTNLLTYSADFGNAAWAVNWGGARSISTNVSTAPDGTLSVDSFTATVGSSGVGQAVSVTAGVTYSFSVWIKTTNANLLARTVSDGGAGTDPKGITVTDTGGQLVRRSFTWTETVTGTRYVGVACSSPVSAEIWGAQLEVGPFITSYIPTTTSQVTRSADNAVMTGANFSSWYSASEGTFLAEFQTLFSSAANMSRGLIGGDASSNKRYLYIGDTTQIVQSYDGVSIASTTDDITGPVAKACSAYDATNRFICSQGSAVQTATVAAGYPATTSIQIGAYGSSTNIFCGHIRRIAYYNARLTNTQLQALTA